MSHSDRHSYEDTQAFKQGYSESTRVVNKHLASPPPHVQAVNITETISPTKGTVLFHAGPEVEKHGHVRVGDGEAISDVVGGKIHVKGAANDLDHHGHADRHHTPDGAAFSDPPKEYVHDGTTYAAGATGEPYDGEEQRPGVATRIKEAIPGTHEHKQKKEREGDLAVYM